MISVGYHNKEVIVPFYELFTGPAQLLLDRLIDIDIDIDIFIYIFT